MTFIQKVDAIEGIEIHEYYSADSFEFTTGNSWYFVGLDSFGRIEIASRCASKSYFSSESEALKFIESVSV